VTYLKNITVKGKQLNFPTFFPDATRAVVRSIDSLDLTQAGIKGLIVNTFHLMTQPGTSALEELGGVKGFMSWPGFIISDSGGFQIMSMIHKNQGTGKISNDGPILYSGSPSKRKKHLLTPERSIEVQFSIGADILICLDYFTDPKGNESEIEKSVVTTLWARRCKDEYLRQVELRGLSDINRPLIFGVIQGGNSKHLREKSAQELIEIGFDGYGFGGWPVTSERDINREILQFTADLMPSDKPKYALGIGYPQDIVDCTKMGYQIFDCVLPTRDARHERLYVFNKDPETTNFLTEKITKYFYILREAYFRDSKPVSEYCDCHTCQNFSAAYLHHLFRLEESLAWRLATIHNLRTYSLTINNLHLNLS